MIRIRYDWLLYGFIFAICCTVWIPFSISFAGLNLRASQILLPLLVLGVAAEPPQLRVSIWSLVSVLGAAVWWFSLVVWTLVNGPKYGHPLGRVMLMGLNLAQAGVLYVLIVRLGSLRPALRALLVSVAILNVVYLAVSIAPSLGIHVSERWLDTEVAPIYVNGELVAGTVQRFVGGGVFAGCISACCAIVATVLWLDTRWTERWLLVVSGVTSLVGMVIGFSRQSVVSLVLGLCVVAPFLLGRGHYVRLVRLAALSLVVMTLALAVVFATPQGRQSWSAFAGRAVQFTDPAAYRTGTAEGRASIWRGMIGDIARNPLVGQGQDSYLAHMDPGEEGAHNFPLEVVHSTGVLGLFGYLLLHGLAPMVAVMALLGRSASVLSRPALVATLGCYAAMILASITNIIYWNPTYWMVVAFMIAAARLTNRDDAAYLAASM